MIIGGIPAMFSAYRRGRTTPSQHRPPTSSWPSPPSWRSSPSIEFWGHQLWKITLVIGIVQRPLIFRVVRASTLSYATRDFVMAAKALGASDRRILAREMLPNIMPTIVSFGLIAVATIIVLEGTLAFLGLPCAPDAELGQHARRGRYSAVGRHGPEQPVVGHLPGRRHVPRCSSPSTWWPTNCGPTST